MKQKTKAKTQKVVANCPTCGNRIYLGSHPKIGDVFVCNRCYLDLEIVNLIPIILDWSPFEKYFYYDEKGTVVK